MAVIVRKERPHPGALLRFTDLGGHRFTCFATDARRGQLAGLELRHRRRARCEDRIRNAKDTGLRNLPLHGFAQNQIWCELVAMACELTAWMQLLALDGPACRPARLADHHQNTPANQGRTAQGPWNPAHPARQPGSPARPGTENQPTARSLSRIVQDRETSRLTQERSPPRRPILGVCHKFGREKYGSQRK
jgi:hypothetical protein